MNEVHIFLAIANTHARARPLISAKEKLQLHSAFPYVAIIFNVLLPSYWSTQDIFTRLLSQGLDLDQTMRVHNQLGF